jgi:uncharacterized protein YjiS (DUF1127 family)
MTTLKMHNIVDDLAISEGTYSLVRRVEVAANKITAMLKTWSVRSNDRRHLAQMSDRMLADIGLNRVDIAIETNKYFWQK